MPDRMSPDDPRHGTVNGYINRECRCGACREAWRLYEPARLSRERYRRRMGMQPAKRGRTHGIRATYVHGCRCSECREAERCYMADYRARQRVAA